MDFSDYPPYDFHRVLIGFCIKTNTLDINAIRDVHVQGLWAIVKCNTVSFLSILKNIFWFANLWETKPYNSPIFSANEDIFFFFVEFNIVYFAMIEFNLWYWTVYSG